MASLGTLLAAAPVSQVTCSSMSIIRRPAVCLSQPCTPMAIHPRPRNPIHNRGVFSPPSTSMPSLLIAAGGKKDKLKKRRKGRRDSTVHKALGPGGENSLTVTSRLSPEDVWEREERRWEREELRWLREEQRWLKEESRWEREREEWAQEEAQLQNHIEALRASLAETQLEAQSRADAMRLSIQEESAQAQMVGEAALGAQLAIDGELQLARARWREEEQALLAEVDALKTALAEVLDEANAKAEAARMTWQKHEATLQAEIAQLKHSLLEAQAVAQARSAGKSAKPAKPASEKALKVEKPETIVRPAPTAEEIIAAVASRTPTPKAQPEVKGVFKTSFSNGAAATNGAPKTAPPAAHRTLRYGAEGPDVKAVQAELERLGFYCGEEEMEADAYEDGTDTAVKSWQCSVGVREDGVLTPELQVLLLGGVIAGAKQGGAAVTEARVEQKDRDVESERFARTAAEGSVSGSTRRVYLLGENRWEEPDRLVPNSAKPMAVGMQKCFACKGEGKVMCTECEGTGDLNVEEQFLSWAGEDPSCPYCNGTGATDCDSCQGSGIEKILIS